MIAAAPTAEKIAAMPAANAATLQQILRRCRVKVGKITYTTLSPSTCDAVIAAQERFGLGVCISAQRVQS